MNIVYIPALAALGGAALGGLTSFMTSWTTLRIQMNANSRSENKSRRQELYKTFITDAAMVYGEALVHSDPDVKQIVRLYAHISRMRVLSSHPVINEADKIMRSIVETYHKPNITLELAVSWEESADLLKSFSEAARAEFEQSSEL